MSTGELTLRANAALAAFELNFPRKLKENQILGMFIVTHASVYPMDGATLPTL
jgi:hypothetical protein